MESEKIKCAKCGAEIELLTPFCPYCGAKLEESVKEIPVVEPPAESCEPVQSDTEPSQGEVPPKLADAASVQEGAQAAPPGVPVPPQEDDAAEQEHANPSDGRPVKKKLSKRGKIIAAAVAAVVLVVVGICCFPAYDQQQKKAAEEAAKTSYNTYVDDLNTAMYQMLLGAADSEEIGNKVLKVWNSAIWKRSAGEWDEEIRAYYADDFNDALKLLYASDEMNKKVSGLKSAKSQVDTKIKQMQSPPSGCENAYQALLSLYDAYSTMVSMASSPTGSYTTYSQEFNSADSAFSKAYDRMKAQIPGKK